MTQRIEFFLNMTQKNRTILFLEYDSKNWLFFEYDPKNWTSFFKYDSEKLEKSNLFEKYDSKNWTFFHSFFFFFPKMTQRIEVPFSYDSKNWTLFSLCLNELNPFDRYDSQNWTLFWTWLTDFFEKKNEYDSQELNLFSLNMTQRIEPFFCMTLSVNWTFFFKKYDLTHRIEPLVMNLFSIWLKELNLLLWTSFQYDSKNWTLLKMSQRIEPLFHSKNWIFFNMTQRFFQIDSKELNPLFSMTQRNDIVFPKWRTELNPYFEYDAKNGTLVLWIRRKELNPFFFEYDAKNWILSLNTTQRIESFFFEYDAKNWKLCLKWLGELNLREKIGQRLEPSFLNLTQRIEPFFWMRLKNWNFLSEK